MKVGTLNHERNFATNSSVMQIWFIIAAGIIHQTE